MKRGVVKAQEITSPAAEPKPEYQHFIKERPLGSVDIDRLSGDELKAYAKRAGVSPRDIEFLTEDRLRQNTKLVIANHFELILEG
jgi:hypothetical protein